MERTWPAAALAAVLGKAAAGATLLADAAGLMHAWTDGEAWLLGHAPAGFAWDAAAQLWRQGPTAFLPDVALPGGWDAAQGRPRRPSRSACCRTPRAQWSSPRWPRRCVG